MQGSGRSSRHHRGSDASDRDRDRERERDRLDYASASASGGYGYDSRAGSHHGYGHGHGHSHSGHGAYDAATLADRRYDSYEPYDTIPGSASRAYAHAGDDDHHRDAHHRRSTRGSAAAADQRRAEYAAEYDDRDRTRRRYVQEDNEVLDWRDQPASPPRNLPSLPPLPPLASASGGGGRMSLSSLLTSAPPPIAPPITPSHASHASRGSPPPQLASPSPDARSRTGHIFHDDLAPSRLPPPRNVASLDYAPASSQLFYGAPPGYTGASTRGGRESGHQHDLRTRDRAAPQGLTPSYASHYDTPSLAHELDDRDGRRTTSNTSSRHSLSHAYDRDHLYGNGNGHGNGYYESRSTRASGYHHLDSPPRVPAPLSLDPRASVLDMPPQPHGYASRLTTSPPPSARGVYHNTRASTSRSPVRMTGVHGEPQGKTVYGERASRTGTGSRRGSDLQYDAYPTSGRGAYDWRNEPLVEEREEMVVAAPAAARERDYDYDHDRTRQHRKSRSAHQTDELDLIPRADDLAPSASARSRVAASPYDDDRDPIDALTPRAEKTANGHVDQAIKSGSVSPNKTVAYKLSDLLAESKSVWESKLQEYQAQREKEVAEIEHLDLEAVHTEMVKAKDKRTKAGRALKAAALAPAADAAGVLGTPGAEVADPFDVKPAVGKGRKGARPAKGKGRRGKQYKSAANVDIEDELLGLAEGDLAAGSSVVAPSSPRMGEDDEDDDEIDEQALIAPDPDTIVLPCGLPRHEVMRRVEAKQLNGLTNEDVRQVQDEMWHKKAEASGAELARRRDGRIKKKPGPAKGWKKLKGEDGPPGSASRRKGRKDEDAPSSQRGESDEELFANGVKEEEEDGDQTMGVDEAQDELGDDADADIAALLDAPEPRKGGRNKKKRKLDHDAMREHDEDQIIAGAFGPIPGTSSFQLDDAASDRRSSIMDIDEDVLGGGGSKRKPAKGKGASRSRGAKKGKERDLLSGEPFVSLPTAYGHNLAEADGSFADDYSVSGDADGVFGVFPVNGHRSGSIPPAHAPLRFDTTPKGSDTNSLPLPPDGGFEEFDLLPVGPAVPKPGKEKDKPLVKMTNVEDPRGVSVEEAHVRLALVEDLQKAVWSSIVKDVPRVYRVFQGFDQSAHMFKLRTAQACQRNAFAQRAQKPTAKSAALVKKDATAKAKKVVREMLLYWRRNEKDELIARRKAEKEALERAKQEEERREAKRQERKLHFLLTQTELYSHFIGKKIKTAEAERPDGETGDGAGSAVPEEDKHADVEGLDGEHAADLPDLDYDEDDEDNLRRHAARGAAAHARAAREKAAQFDQQRAQKGAAAGDVDLKGVDLDGDELNFQEPSLGANSVTITQPKILMAQLKEYQLKGLTWLGNLYEQGINGILADEMGLGKTIQSISLLAYLAEQHNLWGPFLVITPVSTLHNWIQEINRFVPALNVIPYWGQPKDRETLRTIWCKRHATYDKDSKFHVLVTSYQMAVQDEKYLSSLKWQYMILDEAQAIKSSSSMRWTTLLGLPCRNRLLLTGTPIQNSMQELWALLHFIMPTLFDSHEEFSEWFSKDIEKTAASGNTGNLQPEQLKRLHMILKPFMLRRVKKHVQKELGEKIEIDVMVEMSQRQKTLYRALRQRVSISELLAQASNLNDSVGTKHLMNLVMQFRKVCSHPDLFERADVVSPFFFGTFSQSGRTTKEGDNMYCPASGRNAIAPTLPRLVWEDKVDRPKEDGDAGDKRWILNNMLSIWSPDWVAKRLKEEQKREDGYGFLKFLDESPARVARKAKGHPLVQLVSGAEHVGREQEDGPYEGDATFAAAKPSNRFTVPPRIPLAELEHDTPLRDITSIAWNRSVLSRKSSRFAIDAASAAPIKPVISSRSYVSEAAASQSDALITRALYGVAPSERNDPYAVKELHNLVPGMSPNGLLAAAPQDQVPRASLNVPPIKRLIVDSAKLARLDELLRELKDGGHRVLLYFQMTKMMDLVEEYLIFRQHKYLRLDGATVLEERRDMVNSWQTNPEIFVFCLSTRAGGLGINLTAADTVIFYDHDWNPSNDAQAMDRAHRVGQTKQVTVYRLITRNTIEERIVRMARAKKDVQDIVVGSKSLNDVAKPSEIASLFMDDEELAESVAKRKQAEASGYVAPAASRQRPKSAFGDGLGGMEDDEDDFFSGGQKATNNEDEDFADVDGNQQGANAAGIIGNGPAGAPDTKKKSGSKKKKPAASGAATPAEGGGEKKKGGTKRKAPAVDAEGGDGKKKAKKVKIVQPEGAASEPAE